jgi:hypothetical protein
VQCTEHSTALYNAVYIALQCTVHCTALSMRINIDMTQTCIVQHIAETVTYVYTYMYVYIQQRWYSQQQFGCEHHKLSIKRRPWGGGLYVDTLPL